jgi:cation transport ATPase
LGQNKAPLNVLLYYPISRGKTLHFTTGLYAGFFEGIEERYRLAFQLISWALATPVLFYSGYPILSSALRSLRRLTLNMDVLVALGALSAYGYSIAMIFYGGEIFFDTASMIITFILLGRFLEAGSRLKAGNAIAELAELQPHEALRVEESGETSMVPVAAVQSGQMIEIIPGDRIPLDGRVVDGEAEVNEAMLTGDNRGVANYIAARCGITDVQAGLGPLEKAALIRALKAKGACVMMVGDGINDAPALTEADIGVTLGHASAIALESASVAILNDDLRLINTLVTSSTRCFSIIRQNLVWAFSYNLIALPLAVSGILHPIISALLMVTSSLVVVSNSLRLKNL